MDPISKRKKKHLHLSMCFPIFSRGSLVNGWTHWEKPCHCSPVFPHSLGRWIRRAYKTSSFSSAWLCQSSAPNGRHHKDLQAQASQFDRQADSWPSERDQWSASAKLAVWIGGNQSKPNNLLPPTWQFGLVAWWLRRGLPFIVNKNQAWFTTNPNHKF